MEKIWYKSYPNEVPKEINPDEFSSLADFFENCCKKYGERKAVTNMGKSLTFSELEEMTAHFASFLQNELKMQKGDRIGIMLPNTLQYYISLFGALRAGLAVVNINPLYTPKELVLQLNDAGVKTLVVVANFASTVEKALEEVSLKHIIVTELGDLFGFAKGKIVNFVVKYVKGLVPPYNIPDAIPFNTAMKQGSKTPFTRVDIQNSDSAFLQYTGGTTGVAKGAVLTHRNILANIQQVQAWQDNTLVYGEEIAILPLPLYHIFTLTCGCFFMMRLGAESILITNPRDIPHFINEIKTSKFSIIIIINTLCNALLNNEKFKDVDFSHLKFSIIGGMAGTKNVADRWKKVTGIHLMEGYGLTETSPVLTINSFHATEFTGGIGYPMPSTEVEIRSEDGRSLGIGEAGELCVKGPQVMSHYWNRPDETKKAFNSDGWFRTGDIVTMDADGLIRLVDRKKDMIVVSGFKVFPNEVEAVLMSHPGIHEAAVIGFPDKNGGEIVKAFIIRRDNSLSKEEVVHYCKKFLTPYKVPHLIEFREELPKSPIGKILRRKLREEGVAAEDLVKQAA